MPGLKGGGAAAAVPPTGQKYANKVPVCVGMLIKLGRWGNEEVLG